MLANTMDIQAFIIRNRSSRTTESETCNNKTFGGFQKLLQKTNRKAEVFEWKECETVQACQQIGGGSGGSGRGKRRYGDGRGEEAAEEQEQEGGCSRCWMGWTWSCSPSHQAGIWGNALGSRSTTWGPRSRLEDCIRAFCRGWNSWILVPISEHFLSCWWAWSATIHDMDTICPILT